MENDVLLVLIIIIISIQPFVVYLSLWGTYDLCHIFDERVYNWEVEDYVTDLLVSFGDVLDRPGQSFLSVVYSQQATPEQTFSVVESHNYNLSPNKSSLFRFHLHGRFLRIVIDRDPFDQILSQHFGPNQFDYFVCDNIWAHFSSSGRLCWLW